MAEFKPIGKTTISQAIIEQITQLVESGELKPGEKLPSERQLCAQFQVGRSSVREAMVTLQAMGIVERKNRSTVLCGDEQKLDPQRLNEISDAFTNVKDVLEARNILEGEIVLLAVERAQKEDIAAISRQVHPEHDFKAYAKMDKAFHYAIAEATHNSVLCSIYQLTFDYLFNTHHIYEEMKNADEAFVEQVITEGVQSHQKILDAICSGDKKSARAAMTEHLSNAETRLYAGIANHNASLSLKDGTRKN